MDYWRPFQVDHSNTCVPVNPHRAMGERGCRTGPKTGWTGPMVPRVAGLVPSGLGTGWTGPMVPRMAGLVPSGLGTGRTGPRWQDWSKVASGL